MKIKYMIFSKVKIINLFFFYLPSIILSIPIQLSIIILSPFVKFRLGKIPVERLGHLAIEMEMYLCDLKKKNTIDIWFYNKKNVSNKYLLNLFSKHIIILPRYIIVPLYYLNLFIPGGEYFLIPRTYNPSRDLNGLIANSKNTLSIPLSHMKKGFKILKKLGIKNSKKIVCLSVRDQAYLEKHLPEINWDKDKFRNPNINNYSKVMQELAKDGYYIFRMGFLVSTKLNFNNEMIIDYANSKFRSEFMDIFLFNICKFAIGGTEGLMQVPIIFRKPISFVNVMQFGYLLSFCKNSTTLPCRFRNKKTDRLLNYKDILKIKFLKTEDFEGNYILIQNNSDEIYHAVYEFIQMLDYNLFNNYQINKKEQIFWSELLKIRDENDKIIHNKIYTKISKIYFDLDTNFLN